MFSCKTAQQQQPIGDPDDAVYKQKNSNGTREET
jgi:hypothetical protein